jgi:hypothetical protein
MPNSHNQMPPEIASARPEVQEAYLRALPYGRQWAVMVALQRPPGTKGTDRSFMEGRMNNQQLDAMPPLQARWLAAEARAAGIDISGKYYCGGLADRRGWRDPEAWVSSVDDVRRVAVKRRRKVEGSVNYDPGPSPPKRVRLAKSIIADEVRKLRTTNPRTDIRELRDRVIEKHAYKAKGRNV